MAYQFADGFDNFGNSYTYTNGYPWDSVQNVNTVATSTGTVRFAAPGSLVSGSIQIGSGSQLTKNLSSSQATIIVGVGIYLTALPGTGYVDIIRFLDAGTVQCSLSINTNGALQFVRGTTTALIGAATPNGTIGANAWHGYRMQITFNGSTGSVVLYLDGSAVAAINSSSLNNIVSANASISQVSIGPQSGTGSSSTTYYDDFYCFDTSGSFLNSLPSNDTRILTKLPSGAGNYTNWTPTGLGSNWQNAAVAPPSTSDYNANNSAGTKDSYAVPSAGLTTTPLFVMTRASLERDDAGPHTPSLLMRSGSTDGTSAATAALASSYAFYDAVFQNDPATSSPWLGSAADSAQIGIVEG